MKHLLTFTTLVFSAIFGFAQTVEICNWDYNKKSAVALTFDDWLSTHPTVVVPALQERDMVATFYFIAKDLNASKISQINTAADLGNEIGNHSMTHSSVDSIIAAEARPSKEKLDAALVSQKALTYDYPFGTFSDATIDSVRNAGHIAARGVWPPTNYRYNFASSDNDYYNLRTVGVGGDGVKTTKDFAKYLTKVINGGGFITYLYHGVAKSGDYANIPKDSLYAQLDTLNSLRDKIWITTVANAVKYHREAKCITIAQPDIETPGYYCFSIEDTLPDSIYNQPLTLKVYNGGKTFCEITQNGENCPILYQTIEYVLFRALPDGNISLKYGEWDLNTVNDLSDIATVTVNRHTVSVSTDETSSVAVYSPQGQTIFKHKGSCTYTVPQSGIYIISVNGLTQKFYIH
ncbi:MAG: polysaccharide deacetylase family protein [Bacteroidales bacterium]|nr:polysaccharide deacetylase family protein [Bacteroidales bacterium]